MTDEQKSEMLDEMRKQYPKMKDPEIRYAIKHLGLFLQSEKSKNMDEATEAYVRKRYQAVLS